VWALSDFRTVFVAVGLIGVLVCWVPSVMLFARLPGGEKFSELYYLGPGHMAEGYPYNVRENESYSVYVGVGNHMDSSSYYVVYLKFRNETDSLPNVTSGVSSALPPLYEHRMFLGNKGSSEFTLAFFVSNVSFSSGKCTIENLAINGVSIHLDKSASWNSENNGYYYQLLIELWIFDLPSSGFNFHNRFVSLWLNVTD
jgi:hypothetical protein